MWRCDSRRANYHAAFHEVVKGDNTVVVDGQTLAGYQGRAGLEPGHGLGHTDRLSSGALIGTL